MVKKTNTAMVIGLFDEGVQPGDCNVVVENLGDYLIGVLTGAVTCWFSCSCLSISCTMFGSGALHAVPIHVMCLSPILH